MFVILHLAEQVFVFQFAHFYCGEVRMNGIAQALYPVFSIHFIRASGQIIVYLLAVLLRVMMRLRKIRPLRLRRSRKAQQREEQKAQGE